MEFFPYFRRPYGYNRMPYYNIYNQNMHPSNNSYNQNIEREQREKVVLQDNKQEENKKRTLNSQSEPIFEIFGIKLYFDDILIASLIFFLYNEGVEDNLLFISLILLLLS